MVSAFDRIVIAVPDLQKAASEYGELLGIQPAPPPQPAKDGEARLWLGLANTVLELVQGQVEAAKITGIVFTAEDAGPGLQAVENIRQLPLWTSNGADTALFRQQQPAAQCSRFKVDHLVLRTTAPEDCIALFSDTLGIRLALDKTAPRWGGRMLFFRVGKLTLEVISALEEDVKADFFWGIAFQCPRLAPLARELAQQGVTLSSLREGRKPGTQVATVKSHALGLPTLLIEPAKPT